MKGKLTAFISDKRYGFIKGEDSTSYFFHYNDFINKSDLGNLCDGLEVKFEPKATPKGYSASKCELTTTSLIDTYEQPKKLIYSRDYKVKGWEIAEDTQWAVFASSTNSPDDAKELAIARAIMVGATGLVNFNYNKTTGSKTSDSGRGVYKYSVHHYSGRIVSLAKKSTNGTANYLEIFSNDNLHQSASKIKEKTTEIRSKSRNYKVFGAFAIACIIFGTVVNIPNAFTMILGIIIFLTVLNYLFKEDEEWLVFLSDNGVDVKSS